MQQKQIYHSEKKREGDKRQCSIIVWQENILFS